MKLLLTLITREAYTAETARTLCLRAEYGASCLSQHAGLSNEEG